MRIRVGDRTYAPSQIEKCIVAISRAVERPVSIQYGKTYEWQANSVDDQYATLFHDNCEDSPWAALCALIKENSRFAAHGVTLEAGR